MGTALFRLEALVGRDSKATRHSSRAFPSASLPPFAKQCGLAKWLHPVIGPLRHTRLSGEMMWLRVLVLAGMVEPRGVVVTVEWKAVVGEVRMAILA